MLYLEHLLCDCDHEVKLDHARDAVAAIKRRGWSDLLWRTLKNIYKKVISGILISWERFLVFFLQF